MLMATIQIWEQSSSYDEYDTENGIGHAVDVEPVLLETTEIHSDSDEPDFDGLDDDILLVLSHHGVDQWDGGNTAYDPDGSHMHYGAAGTITTTWATITKETTP